MLQMLRSRETGEVFVLDTLTERCTGPIPTTKQTYPLGGFDFTYEAEEFMFDPERIEVICEEKL